MWPLLALALAALALAKSRAVTPPTLYDPLPDGQPDPRGIPGLQTGADTWIPNEPAAAVLTDAEARAELAAIDAFLARVPGGGFNGAAVSARRALLVAQLAGGAKAPRQSIALVEPAATTPLPGSVSAPATVTGAAAPERPAWLSTAGGKLRLRGQLWKYHGATKFSFAFQVHTHDNAGVQAGLDQLNELSLPAARVLTTAKNLFDLAPADGAVAIRAVLEYALVRNQIINVIALADTRDRGMSPAQCLAHAEATAAVCADFPNAFWEFGNELDHGTQIDALHDPDWVQTNAAAIARKYGLGTRWSCGTFLNDETLVPNGAIVLRHLTRDTDKMIRHIRDLAGVGDELGKPVISNEPLGADEPGGTHGQRYKDAGTAFALGLVSEGFLAGWTFHSQWGIEVGGLMPANQATLARAMVAGARVFPPNTYPAFYNAHMTFISPNSHGWDSSPVFRADLEDRDPAGVDRPGAAQRAFSFTWGESGITVVVGKRASNVRVEFGNGWGSAGQLATPADSLDLYRITKGGAPWVGGDAPGPITAPGQAGTVAPVRPPIGRFKVDGDGHCQWAATDVGIDQCLPAPGVPLPWETPQTPYTPSGPAGPYIPVPGGTAAPGVSRPAGPGRYKVGAGGACEWAPGDTGKDQCTPANVPSTDPAPAASDPGTRPAGPGRYKVGDGGACVWTPGDVGPDQCLP